MPGVLSKEFNPVLKLQKKAERAFDKGDHALGMTLSADLDQLRKKESDPKMSERMQGEYRTFRREMDINKGTTREFEYFNQQIYHEIAPLYNALGQRAVDEKVDGNDPLVSRPKP